MGQIQETVNIYIRHIHFRHTHTLGTHTHWAHTHTLGTYTLGTHTLGTHTLDTHTLGTHTHIRQTHTLGTLTHWAHTHSCQYRGYQEHVTWQEPPKALLVDIPPHTQRHTLHYTHTPTNRIFFGTHDLLASWKGGKRSKNTFLESIAIIVKTGLFHWPKCDHT